MQKSLSYEDLVRLEDLFDKFVKHKNACLSEAEHNESLLYFQTTFRDTDEFETLEQFEEAVFNGDAWDFKCDTTAPEDPQPKADEEDRRTNSRIARTRRTDDRRSRSRELACRRKSQK